MRQLRLIPVPSSEKESQVVSAEAPAAAQPTAPPPEVPPALPQVTGTQQRYQMLALGPQHREQYDVVYTVLPLAPGSWVPTAPCATCGSRTFRTYYWVAARHHDAQGRPAPYHAHQWSCARCQGPLPHSTVAEFTITE